MAQYTPKVRDFYSQGDSQKALELKEAFAELQADISALVTWGNALAAKLNAEAASGVTNFDTNYTGPTL